MKNKTSIGLSVVELATLFLFVCVVIVVLSLIMAFPFMWIWNYAVVSAITVANPITYGVAFWLMCFMGWFVVGTKSSVNKSS